MVRGPAPRAALAYPSSRRALLHAAALTAAGGTAAALAACTKASKSPPTSTPDVRPAALAADVGVLNTALDLEHTAIAAYTAGAPLLVGTALATARQFLAQEFSHATELSLLIHKGGGRANPPSATYDLGNPRQPKDVLLLLHRIEQMQIAAYLEAIPKLTPGGVRSTVASILANHAQHISVLREALGRAPVPGAFVTAGE